MGVWELGAARPRGQLMGIARAPQRPAGTPEESLLIVIAAVETSICSAKRYSYFSNSHENIHCLFLPSSLNQSVHFIDLRLAPFGVQISRRVISRLSLCTPSFGL
jgi:hypothetical protein